MHPRAPHETAKSKTRKRKKMPDGERLWTGKGVSQKKGSGDAYGLRADKTKIVEVNGQNAPYRVTVLVEKDRIKTQDPAKLARCEIELEQIEPNTPTHAKVQTIIRNEDGSPVQVATPSGTILKRRLTTGLFHFFDNRLADRSPVSNKRIVREIDASDEFFQSEGYDKIKKLHVEEKAQDLTITKKTLAKTKAINAKNGNRRVISQNRVMAVSGKDKDGSATQYAEPLPIARGTKKNHAHLVMHKVTGPNGQIPENISITTEENNTAMQLPESIIEKLVASYPAGVRLKPSARHVKVVGKENQAEEYLQMATVIKYPVIAGDDELHFEFNAQSDIKPHITYKDYPHSFVGLMTNDPKTKRIPMTMFERNKHPSATTTTNTPLTPTKKY